MYVVTLVFAKKAAKRQNGTKAKSGAGDSEDIRVRHHAQRPRRYFVCSEPTTFIDVSNTEKTVRALSIKLTSTEVYDRLFESKRGCETAYNQSRRDSKVYCQDMSPIISLSLRSFTRILEYLVCRSQSLKRDLW